MADLWLPEWASQRVAICGVPHSGKTTLARDIAREQGGLPKCTDPEALGGDVPQAYSAWGVDSAWVCTEWLQRPGPWVIEGVGVARALRKWKATHPGEPPPVDALILLGLPWTPLTPKQEAMGKGVITVLKEILPWLEPIIQRRPRGPLPSENSELDPLIKACLTS